MKNLLSLFLSAALIAAPLAAQAQQQPNNAAPSVQDAKPAAKAKKAKKAKKSGGTKSAKKSKKKVKQMSAH